MQLKTENGRLCAVMNFDQIRDALSKLNENGNSFAILEDGERFIQTAIDGPSMVLEKNEGSRDQHYRASLNGSEQLSLPKAESIFRSWYEQAPSQGGVQWSKIEVHGISRPARWLLWALPWVAGAYLVYRFALSSYDLWEWLR